MIIGMADFLSKHAAADASLAALNSPALFIDTAPILYHLEDHARYRTLLHALFAQAREGRLRLVTSTLTLLECFLASPEHGQACRRLLDDHAITLMVPIDRAIHRQARLLQARHELTRWDALQIAVALDTRCDALLTNDRRLLSVRVMPIVILERWSHEN